MRVYIKLSQEIPPISLFDANIGTETRAVIDRATAKPAEARTIYAKEYVDGNRYLAAASYDRAFNKYYEAGKKGMSFSDIKRSSRDIKADSARRIYEAGRRATENESKRQSKYKQTAEYKSRSEARTEANTKAKKKGGVIRSYAVDKKINRLQRQQLRVLDEWARQEGITIRVVESLSEKIKLDGKIVNGLYDGGNVITIALDGKNMLTSTAGHELYHMIKELAPEHAEAFRAFVVDHLKEAGEYDSVFGDYERRYKNTYKVDESFKAKIEEEIVADHCFEALTNKKQWEKFAGEHKSIAEKIIDFIREFVAKINNAFDKYFVHDNAYIRDSVIGEVEYMNKIADMLWEGVDKAVENYRSGAVNESGETKYSIEYTTDNKAVAVIQDDILKGVSESDWIRTVKDTISGKFPKGIPVSGRLIKVNRITKNEFVNSKDSRMLKKNDKAIYKDKYRSANNLDDIVLASTNYINEDLNHTRKDNFKEFARGDVLIRVGSNDYSAEVIVGLTSANNMVLYDIIKFTPQKFTLKQKKMKAHNTAMNQNGSGSDRKGVPSSDTTVTQGNSNVNTHSMQNSKNNSSFSVSDSNGNQLSENQQKYFADSKVRDENGNLLVVRHGTNNEFNIFDFTKAGKNGAQEGYGFYFSDDPEITEKYGSIQKECYLNITKPLYNNQVTVNKTEIKKLADALIDFDIEKYADEDLTWQDSFLSNYVDTYSMSRAAAVREFVDQLFSANDNDSDLVFEMAVADGRSYDPMLVKEFYDVLTDSIGYDGIIAEWKHKDGTSNVYVIFNSEQAKLTDNQNPTDNPDVRYSISKKFYDDFDKWDGKDTNTTFEIGNTSKALQSIGIKDQQFIMRSGMVRQKLNKHSELTRSTFRNIPELLEHPIIVQFSDAIDPKTGKAKYDSRITLLGELYAEMTVDGKKQKTPVLVSVELLPKSKGKTEISDFSVITSAYAKSNLQRYINENSILYINPDKKRTNKWLSLNRLQLPLGENRLGSIRRITYIGGKVKIENSKNFSPMQAALEKAGVVNSSGISLLNNSENDTDFSEKILSDDQRASVSDAGMRLTDNAELSSLMRDNADYKAEIERLKGEFVKSKRMGGKGKNRLVQADINRIVRSIIGEYSSKIDFSTLRDELTGLYELMDNIEIQGSADYAELVKLSNDIAKSVIASSYVDITDQSAEKYKAAMRSYRLTPSLQDVAELEDMFGTFGAAYRQYGRKLNMRAQGTPGALHIDEVWEDLCDSVPFLDRDAESTQDMWRNLIEVRDSLDEKNGFNPYITDGDLTANEAAGALGADILERFNEVRADTTFADRAQQRVDLRFPIVVMRIKIFSLTGCSDIINPSPNRTLSRNPLTARPTAHTLVLHDIKQCKQVYQRQCIMHKIVFVCKRCGLKAHSGRTESHLQGILERLGQNRQPLVSWQMILERRDRRLCPRL